MNIILNVIRDSSANENSKLPVGVWIHGGGFFEGSSADQRYNMSAIVANSYKIGKPFIAVSLNYRLSAWGFLSSSQVWGTGNTNLAAYGGRDDGLFRGGIMESGGTIAASPANYTGYQALYDELAGQVGCSDVVDSLQCLREVPFEKLNAALNTTSGNSDFNFGPVIDGDIIRDWGSLQLDKHEFVKVPILAGTNTDEGTAFGPTGINTTEEFYAYLTDGESGFQLPPTIAQEILQLYPDDPALGIPEFLGDTRVPSKGYQWRRTCAYAGDYVMHANRRRQCEAWTETSTTAYCYRFNMRAADVPILSGATHFEEVAFVFNNIAGLGYHYGKPFAGMPESYVQLSNLMTSMWASFIHDLDPNSGIKDSAVQWQPYGKDQPVDLVFDANVTSYSYMEPDTWRKEGIDYINSVANAYWR